MGCSCRSTPAYASTSGSWRSETRRGCGTVSRPWLLTSRSHEFAVSCLVNRDTMRRAPLRVEVPDGVLVERPPANLGWPGGLHLLRTLSDAELFVWVQDDMLPEPGWLDALVDAADAHPSVGVFGALRVDDQGTGAGAQRRMGAAPGPGRGLERHRHDSPGHPDRGHAPRLGHEQGLPHADPGLRRGRRPGPAAVAAQPRRQGLLDACALPRVRRRAGPVGSAAPRTEPVRAVVVPGVLERVARRVVRRALGRPGDGSRGTNLRSCGPPVRGVAHGGGRPGRGSVRARGDRDARAVRPGPGLEPRRSPGAHEAEVQSHQARVAELEQQLVETEAQLLRVRRRARQLRRRLLRQPQPSPSFVARLSHRLRRLR